jgi:hypothetical protein
MNLKLLRSRALEFRLYFTSIDLAVKVDSDLRTFFSFQILIKNLIFNN